MNTIMNENTEKNVNKRPYIPKGNVKIGRPTDKTAEEIIANKRRLEKEYSVRRGRFITKIKYYIARYEIPKNICDLPQNTEETIRHKCKVIYDFVREQRWGDFIPNTLDNSDNSDTPQNTENSSSDEN